MCVCVCVCPACILCLCVCFPANLFFYVHLRAETHPQRGIHDGGSFMISSPKLSQTLLSSFLRPSLLFSHAPISFSYMSYSFIHTVLSLPCPLCFSLVKFSRQPLSFCSLISGLICSFVCFLLSGCKSTLLCLTLFSTYWFTNMCFYLHHVVYIFCFFFSLHNPYLFSFFSTVNFLFISSLSFCKVMHKSTLLGGKKRCKAA